MENKKEKSSESGCFFICSSGKKKKNQEIKKLQKELETKSLEKQKSSASITSEVKDKDDVKGFSNYTDNKTIDEKNQVKNLNSSKQYKSSSHLDFSLNDNHNHLKNSEIIIESSKKLEISYSARSLIAPIPDKKGKYNMTNCAGSKNNKLNSSSIKEDITFRNKLALNESGEIKPMNNIFQKDNKQTNLTIEVNAFDLNTINSKITKNSKIGNISVLNINADTSVNNIQNKTDNISDHDIKNNSIILPKPEFKNEDEIDEDIRESKEILDNNSNCGKSVISSNILSYIRQPKSISNIKSDNVSVHTKSDNSVNILNENDLRMSQQSCIKPFSQFFKTSTELSELEMINENDRFQRYIETPKSINLKNCNPNLKSLVENIQKKDESIKHLNGKIDNIKIILNNYDQENSKISNKIQKEEDEAERLRQILNFLLSQRD